MMPEFKSFVDKIQVKENGDIDVRMVHYTITEKKVSRKFSMLPTLRVGDSLENIDEQVANIAKATW